MTIILIIFGLLLALLGLVGCILPVIPGPALSFLALIVLSWAKHWEPFSLSLLIIMAALTIAVTFLDYVIPAMRAKRYGASKSAIWLSIIGMLLGILFFPPWGMIIGAFAGALLGELVGGKDKKQALKSGWGIFVGNMIGMGLKLAFCGIMLFLYIKEMF
ncbi:MAG: DUF456 domain-containing protein [Desulfobacterales bacterium]|nr:DUF456 domain-containing protein [Desulfobacterales bacterium]